MEWRSISRSICIIFVKFYVKIVNKIFTVKNFVNCASLVLLVGLARVVESGPTDNSELLMCLFEFRPRSLEHAYGCQSFRTLTFSRLGVSYSAYIKRCEVRYWDGRPYPGSIPGAGHLFRYVTNQRWPPMHGQLSLLSREVGKWVPASAGKAKAGSVWFIPLVDVRGVCR